MNDYCYWSVAYKDYVSDIIECCASASLYGMNRCIHLISDTKVDKCECYDIVDLHESGELYKIIYLKAGISKLHYNKYIWIDADSRFVGRPNGILNCMKSSPIHVPLRCEITEENYDCKYRKTNISYLEYKILLKKGGVFNEAYLPCEGFFIIDRNIIDIIYEYTQIFLTIAKSANKRVDATLCLGYAMQMLCAQPKAHLMTCNTHVWNEICNNANGNQTSGIMHLQKGMNKKYE